MLKRLLYQLKLKNRFANLTREINYNSNIHLIDCKIILKNNLYYFENIYSMSSKINLKKKIFILSLK